MKIKEKRQDRTIDIIFTIILILIAIIALYPLWFVLIASFSNPTEIAAGNVIFLPKDISLDGYKEMMNHPEIWIGYRNSLLYLFGGAFAGLAVILPAAYALSRSKLKGRRVLNFLFVVVMYFSGGIIPTYLLHNSLGWVNTPWVIVIPAALNVANMIIARSSFEAIPEALYESASIDGANDFRFFFQFALPLVKATIAVLFLFYAIGYWNEYMRFVIYVREPEFQSLQVIIHQITEAVSAERLEGMSAAQLMQEQKVRDLLKYCVVVIAALPFTILYPFIQKYFNGGVMVGAVKG